MPIPAAQYLRMSTENQRFSMTNQSAAIAAYAKKYGYIITKTYSDGAKSGLKLKNRDGLRRLLQDVVSHPQYQAILVYDVSRWGRFQDPDESAAYEFICRSSGIPVRYCAELFVNDGSLMDSLFKSIKRSMAAEYSRELSVKVLAGQKRLATLGYHMGGIPGIGLRRVLVTSDGKRRILHRREEKNLKSDKVVLARGPESEVEVVKLIFRLAKKYPTRKVAEELNRRGSLPPSDKPWCSATVIEILHNPKYTGMNIWGRRTQILRTPFRRVAREKWAVQEATFEPIISKELYDEVQSKIESRRTKKISKEECISALRRELQQNGRLSQQIIHLSRSGPCYKTYVRTFGSMNAAYSAVGWTPSINRKEAYRRRRSRLVTHRKVLAQLLKANPGSEAVRVHWSSRRLLRLRNGRTIAIYICQPIFTKGSGTRWLLRIRRRDWNYPIFCCLLNADEDNIERFELRPPRRLVTRLHHRLCEPGIVIRSLARLSSPLLWRRFEQLRTQKGREQPNNRVFLSSR